MKTHYHHPLMLFAMLLGCLFQCAQAEENGRFLLQDSDGFVTSLPNISNSTVTLHLIALQQDLETQLGQLKEEVQRKSFKAIDTLVAVVMPGGLIYAKLRLDSFRHSKQAMNRVNEELAQISDELVAFQADNGEIMIAIRE